MPDQLIADTSEFQQNVDWYAYTAGGFAGGIARACYGNAHKDNQWDRNLPLMRQHLRFRGFYGYIRASQDIPSQARFFASIVGKLQPGEVAIADFEEGTGDQSGRAAQWGQIVQPLVGDPINPWDYSGVFFAQAHNLRVAWVAGYGQREPSVAHELWQFTDQQRFPGIASPCDASLFHGTIDDLIALVTPGQGGTRLQPEFSPPVLFEGMVAECPWRDPTSGQVTGWLVLGVNGGVENLGAAPYLGSPEENKENENWVAGGRKGAQILQHVDGWGYIIKSDADTATSPGYNYRVAGH